MDAIEWGLLAAMALAVVALIEAERRGSLRGMWIAKPLASACFVALALRRGVPSLYDTFHAGLLAGVALCFVGDLLLIPREARIFRASIIAFLLAHVAFTVAFAPSIFPEQMATVVVALVPLVVAAVLVARWILPRAPPQLKPAVVAYMVVITAMVAAAAATRNAWLIGAALAFWGNDILVARDRFVSKDWRNRLVGLPFYYASMAVFALHASGTMRV